MNSLKNSSEAGEGATTLEQDLKLLKQGADKLRFEIRMAILLRSE